MITLLMNNLLWTEGFTLALVLGAVMLAGIYFSRWLFLLGFIPFLFCLYFFRNPDRICSELFIDPRVIVCPADGRVVEVVQSADNREEGYAQKVAIFLSPLDVHVNWIPMHGTISLLNYRAGKFTPAFLPKSSELNERNDIQITDTRQNRCLMVRQIAGAMARRIVCWVKGGQEVVPGQKYGMIKFGSRVEVFLPAQVDLEIKVGQKVYGGRTVLGRWQ